LQSASSAQSTPPEQLVTQLIVPVKPKKSSSAQQTPDAQSLGSLQVNT